MSDNTGGPAFPVQGFSTRAGQGFQLVMADGMTLRDYFAAKAMQALMPKFDLASSVEVAEWAYQFADEMLEARKQ